MTSIWDLYLDAADAADVLYAAAVLERHRAVREPLPLEDAERLLERLTTIARIAHEETGHWDDEADDRRIEADVDGGRWGDPDVAGRMAAIAAELAAGSRKVAEAADTAVADLGPRLDGSVPDDDSAEAAEDSTGAVQRLLSHDPDAGPGHDLR